jgi:hypothetical protein
VLSQAKRLADRVQPRSDRSVYAVDLAYRIALAAPATEPKSRSGLI